MAIAQQMPVTLHALGMPRLLRTSGGENTRKLLISRSLLGLCAVRQLPDATDHEPRCELSRESIFQWLGQINDQGSPENFWKFYGIDKPVNESRHDRFNQANGIGMIGVSATAADRTFRALYPRRHRPSQEPLRVPLSKVDATSASKHVSKVNVSLTWHARAHGISHKRATTSSTSFVVQLASAPIPLLSFGFVRPASARDLHKWFLADLGDSRSGARRETVIACQKVAKM